MQYRRPEILIVDDLEENRKVLSGNLSSIDAELYMASSGTQALELVSKHDISMVILDTEMPEMDGFQVLNQLSSDEETQHIPVILLVSQLSTEKQKLYGNIVSLIDIVYKPINQTLFLAKIKKYLQLHQYREVVKHRHDENEKLLKAIHEGVLGIDSNGIILFANASAGRMLGKNPAQLLGVYLETLLEEPHHKAVSEWTDHPIRKACLDGNILHVKNSSFRRKDGSKFKASFAAVPVSDMEGMEIIFAFKELAADKKNDEKLSELSQRDHLTGLPNRVRCEELIEESIARAKEKQQCMAVLILDLDHFRNINESLGHDMGDKLIKFVVERLKLAVRETDVIGRMGGDQFPLVVDGIQRPEDAAGVAHKVQDQLSKPFLLEGHEISISASIGIATYPACGDSASELIKNADTAASRGKLFGGNNYQFFNVEMNTLSIERLELESQLHYAIDRNELNARVLRMSHLDTDALGGYKLEVVWNHPKKGAIEGHEFRSLIECTGMQVPIGEWSLKTGFSEFKKGIDGGSLSNDQTLMIDLAAVQLMQDNFVDDVLAQIKRYGLQVEKIIFLFEENAVLNRTHDCRDVIATLHDKGCKIAINNFGSGFSSLSLIQSIPVDYIVIGTVFSELESSKKAQVIVQSLVSMAHQLNILVVAQSEISVSREVLAGTGMDYLLQ
ncbi:MAG: hypothetical protein COB04_15675 [Gammaproteobacteria bacterium]|nr:MAG: hypothetical protein COB04_15675 [Gammaproteobacteria bacterium]